MNLAILRVPFEGDDVLTIPLERACPDCNGEGGSSHNWTCGRCLGTGIILTDNGEAILAVVERHGGTT